MGIATAVRPQTTETGSAYLSHLKTAPAVADRAESVESAPEVFSLSEDGLRIERTVRLRNGDTHTTVFELNGTNAPRANPTNPVLAMLADQLFLRSAEWPPETDTGEEVRTADVFSGCGAMSLGVWEACRAARKRMKPILAVDTDPVALKVFKKNFPSVIERDDDITQLLDSPLGASPSKSEKTLAELAGRIDLLLGGPPCQGHSDLNNHTRRADPKNGLYERMARFAEVVKARNIIIENVPAVMHDKGRVVDATARVLTGLGYSLDHGIVEISTLGVPQRRRRHVLVASLKRAVTLDKMIGNYERSAPNVRWAISDLRWRNSGSLLDVPSTPTTRNRKRIEYLFKHDLYDLPDSKRPDCHRLYSHTYRSVYGRLRWDKPAQTITGGFGCMGQGRFVHPGQTRTITPHEAARLQFIPDFFNFEEVESRTAMAQIIGNAVPPKLTYVIALELLR